MKANVDKEDFVDIDRFRATMHNYCPHWVNDGAFNRIVESHFGMRHYCHGSFSAPVQNLLTNASDQPVRILDPVCGNGIWLLEMATTYPDVQCFGSDPLGVFPTGFNEPTNLSFSHEDATLGLKQFPDEYFDFIHVQLIYHRFPRKMRKVLMEELGRLLKPGGFIELRDVDPLIKSAGPVTTTVTTGLPKVMADITGHDLRWTHYMIDYIKLTGAADVCQQRPVMPIGWGDDMARLTRDYVENAFCSFKDIMMQGFGWDEAKFIETKETVLQESVANHSFVEFCICWGAKPLEDLADHASDICFLTEDFDD
ncbi:S-adenosyl-L-methionine-dependent methyltransferase [Hesseltinella vesiculosa]|uniref:S-adenosyl-L-methionine-dependent methyltransferase n=1 Tax=Hesseltinella vesiculosa TaxID=101127 RepID=A0A1X2GS58_9FUNG|nr:S-adenosyl-L-methionine-dependent methyltransferase [Hesseltinella vesiculosa]